MCINIIRNHSFLQTMEFWAKPQNFQSSVEFHRITVCTVVQNCCKGRSKKYRKYFWCAPSQKPINESTQNLAGVITSVKGVNMLNGISIGSGAWSPRRGEMLMVCAFYLTKFFCSFFSATGGQTVGPILTSDTSKCGSLGELHSFWG